MIFRGSCKVETRGVRKSTGRVGSHPEAFQSHGSGLVGSGRVGSGRVTL